VWIASYTISLDVFDNSLIMLTKELHKYKFENTCNVSLIFTNVNNYQKVIIKI